MTEAELADVIVAAVRRESVVLLAKLAAKIEAIEARPVVAPDVVSMLADTVADHRTRLIAVEARAPIPGPQGPPGAAGATGAIGEQGPPGEKGLDGLRGEKGLDGVVGQRGPQGEKGADGDKGIDGKDGLSVKGDPGEVGPMGPAGKDGAPGLQGKDGRDGIDGKDGLSVKGDPGARGEMGPMGPTGLSVKGETGATGDTGPAGRDGLGLTAALVDRHGHLIVTFSDGQTKDVGPVVGKDGAAGVDGQHWDPVETKRLITEAVAAIPVPKDGKDGKDGLGFDHMGLVFDEINGVRLKFEQGDRVEEHAIPVPYDAKVWQEGRLYRQGAGVTRQGAWWIAQKDTRTRPGDEGSDWRLAVKAGRDGKPGKDGRNGDGT